MPLRFWAITIWPKMPRKKLSSRRIERCQALREPAAFAAWFRTIIFKHCDRVTRRKRHPITGLEAALEVASPEPSPHETLESRERQQSVREAIATLSDAERQVVLLYYMGEHSTAVIAAFLEVTANAVKTRLYAARQRLRKYMGEIEENLNAARPSSDPKFAEKVQRMIRPEALKKNDHLFWSPGIGADVWEMFCAAITGDLETIKRLLDKDPSLARANYEYRTPLHFAVRENQLEVAAYLLEHGATFSFGNVLEDARDRGYIEMQKLLEAALAVPHDTVPKGAAIAEAIRERDLTKVRRLLDADSTLVHASDERTNQPIHWAAMTRQPDIIDELLARGQTSTHSVATARVQFSLPTAIITFAAGAMCHGTGRPRRAKCSRTCAGAAQTATSAPRRTSAIWNGCANCLTMTHRWPIAHQITSPTTPAPGRRYAMLPVRDTLRS